ncbi:GNAT family acetyltransferase [Fusarium albosuccineum]|uniref:GNAT family acetyltransferase n=1 Tax=Fusarium albosuccineum TaxID=1237068 RepID=A0A8H4LI15_9HYPO|nr:GNAT family acetyltransferase [Fusarium albosuccineum]
MAFTIQPATPDEIPAIVDFVMTARADMFPMLDQTSHKQLAERELVSFQQTYLDHPEAAFLTARADGRLIATIGYVPYDHRFPQLEIEHKRVVEVIRLYVDPSWRRAGLASKLHAALEQTAHRAGIEQLYLHTHPFLPGAIRFWERQGFSIIQIEDDPVWHTTHMSRFLGD